MTIDSGSRTVHSGAHAALVGVEVLVLDADERVHAGIAQLLGEASLHVTAVATAERALALIDKQFFSVALIDIDTPTPGAGIATIADIKRKSPTTMIVALTPRRSYEDAVEAVRSGAVDLVLKAPESVAYLNHGGRAERWLRKLLSNSTFALTNERALDFLFQQYLRHFLHADSSTGLRVFGVFRRSSSP